MVAGSALEAALWLAGAAGTALLAVSMYSAQPMKPISTTNPAIQNLKRNVALSAAGGVKGIGREGEAPKASRRLSCRSGMGFDAAPPAADGSAPSRAAHAVQKRAVARFSSPHSAQMIVAGLALDIALHCA